MDDDYTTPAPVAVWSPQHLLGILAMAIFAGALLGAYFLDNDTLRTQMFTAAAVGFGTTLGYFFGSSAGSQKKDDVLAANSAALAASTPPPPKV